MFFNFFKQQITTFEQISYIAEKWFYSNRWTDDDSWTYECQDYLESQQYDFYPWLVNEYLYGE